MWKKIDEAIQDRPIYWESDDLWYYAREYVSHGGFEASEANQLINNFKIEIKHKNTQRWKYKINAIRQFADELRILLPEGSLVSYIPTSKHLNDPDYDNRFELTLSKLVKTRPDIKIERLLSSAKTIQPSHLSGGKRASIDEINKNLVWEGLKSNSEYIILIDDVITCGRHFRACEKMVLKKAPNIKRIIGVFWAKTIWENDD